MGVRSGGEGAGARFSRDDDKAGVAAPKRQQKGISTSWAKY
jgi:hypothetical protein